MAEARRAVALISGGLDSLLAAKVVMDQGIEVEGVNFFTGFCVEGHTHAIRDKKRSQPKRNNALWVAEQLGIKLHIIDVIEQYKDVLLKPKFGYGANLNPCLDCKVFMVRKARELFLDQAFMTKHRFDFVVTGEVMGQRPMSQRKQALPVIAKESGIDDLLLRPLSARHLEETRPEREGWIDRSKLYGFHGRNRKPQIALAEQLGLRDWAQPAGGCCFLTDPSYAKKLGDLWQAQGHKDYELDDIVLLKVGRHLRPAPNFKLIIGREAGENQYLKGYKDRFATLETVSHPGGYCVVDGELQAGDLELAARLVARYSQGREESQVTVEHRLTNGVVEQISIAPMPAHEIPKSWHV